MNIVISTILLLFTLTSCESMSSLFVKNEWGEEIGPEEKKQLLRSFFLKKKQEEYQEVQNSESSDQTEDEANSYECDHSCHCESDYYEDESD